MQNSTLLANQIHLLQVHETSENADWQSHMLNLECQVNLGMCNEVDQVKHCWDTFVAELKHANHWKKEPVSNHMAFAADQHQSYLNGNNGDKWWKHDNGLSSSCPRMHNGHHACPVPKLISTSNFTLKYAPFHGSSS